MAEAEEKTNQAEQAHTGAAPPNRGGTNGETRWPENPATPNSNGRAGLFEPPHYLAEALDEAERLLKYSAETGVLVDSDLREKIVHARAIGRGRWTEDVAANVLTSLTKLSASAKPVTAKSLKACDNTRPAIRLYFWVAISLAFIIVPFSVLSFLTSAISTAIRNDIGSSNDLVVKLRVMFPTSASAVGAGGGSSPSPAVTSGGTGSALPTGISPTDVITDLQLFASDIRAVDARARQLNVLVLNRVRDPNAAIRHDPVAIHKKFELPDGLPDLAQAANERIIVYQDVRYFAQNVLENVSFYYGAITTCILPVLYALLGTCAYLLRSFEQQIGNRTFMPSEVNIARFLIAGIGGAVVGLFNNFNISQAASIPPLAIAFLVGYAVDVFFAFLEGLLQSFAKNTPSPQPTSGAGSKA